MTIVKKKSPEIYTRIYSSENYQRRICFFVAVLEGAGGLDTRKWTDSSLLRTFVSTLSNKIGAKMETTFKD